MSDEGSIVRVSEVDGQDALSEFFDFLDHKSLPAFGPADDIAVLGVLNLGQGLPLEFRRSSIKRKVCFPNLRASSAGT